MTIDDARFEGNGRLLSSWNGSWFKAGREEGIILGFVFIRRRVGEEEGCTIFSLLKIWLCTLLDVEEGKLEPISTRGGRSSPPFFKKAKCRLRGNGGRWGRVIALAYLAAWYITIASPSPIRVYEERENEKNKVLFISCGYSTGTAIKGTRVFKFMMWSRTMEYRKIN